MYFYNVYKCPECEDTLAENGDIQKHFCSKCGTVMIIDRRVECLDSEEKKAQENQINQDIKQINTELLGTEEIITTPEAPKEPKLEKPQEKEVQSFKSDFEFNSPISINESSKSGTTIISGTLLSEGLSKNGNLYTVESLEQLDGLTDIPIYVGTGTSNMHTKASGIIGKIIKTTFDRIKRKVTFIAEIFNKTIAESVKSGWGISIGGKADGSIVLDSAGKVLTKIKSLILNHVQLLMPSTRRGLDSAKVESVEIQETMFFSNIPKLSKSQIAQIVASLIANGEIKID